MIKKYLLTIHPDLDSEVPLRDTYLGECLTPALRQAWKRKALPLPILPGSICSALTKYLSAGTPEFLDLCDAFHQAASVETSIMPRMGLGPAPDHLVSVEVRFYRKIKNRERELIFSMVVGLNTEKGDMKFLSEYMSQEFFTGDVKLKMGQLLKSRPVPNDTNRFVRIDLGEGEELQIQYHGSVNDYPRGVDYYDIRHYKENRTSSTSIEVSPFYRYVVDLGHNLVFHPSPNTAHNLLRPDAPRCTCWSVKARRPGDWQDIPTKTLMEVREKRHVA